MKIQVQSLFRNSEKNLERVLKQFDELSNVADCSFRFYENDSEDNILSILKGWGKAKVFSEKLKSSIIPLL